MMKATFKSLREAEMPHIALALLMLTGMLAAWTTPHLLHDAAASKAVLGIAIGIASVPLLFDLLRQMMKGNFNVDLLAAISVVSAILFDEYWVAAIVVLMLAGGSLKKAGSLNEAPDLQTLDNGDLIYKVDFRQVYATILGSWMATDAEIVLGQKFGMLDFV